MSQLFKKVLKEVSRSFYLSMRVLPAPMREPVSLGYLLARASDTLADSDSLESDLRMELLVGMEEILNGGERESWLKRLKREVVPQQSHRGEKVLLQNMEGVLDWLDHVESESLKKALLTVMGHILRGQRLDIERFEIKKQAGLRCADDLEEYCYLVAGCVGEFWTEIGINTLKNFSLASLDQLMTWGANYGKGLQLINILRDLPNDFKKGRCYLPGVDVFDHDSVLQEAAKWRKQARDYLADGELYADSLKWRRTHFATALPRMIGEKTLDLLDDADWGTLSRGVKIKRNEVYRCAVKALLR